MKQRAHCITLRRTPERREAFKERWRTLEHADVVPIFVGFPAVDAKLCPKPAWWRAGRGAWGCFRSHMAIVEQELNHYDPADRVWVMEDDAFPMEGFAERVGPYLEAVPDDADLIYLGGQYLKRRREQLESPCPGVYRVFNCNRTHALIWTRGGLEKVYREFMGLERFQERCREHDEWVKSGKAKVKKPGAHIDHLLGLLTEQGILKAYAPEVWLCGQVAGRSTVSESNVREKTWEPTLPTPSPAPRRKQQVRKAEPIPNATEVPKGEMIAVVGPFSGGTSAVAGLLHKGGVQMGRRFHHIKDRGINTWEAHALGQLLRRHICERTFKPLKPEAVLIHALRSWATDLRPSKGRWGGKHPLLCFAIDEIEEAWNEPVYVRVLRDTANTVASLRRRGWRASTPIDAEEAVRMMNERLDADLPKERTVEISYDALMQMPATVCAQLSASLGTKLAPEALDALRPREEVRHV